MRAHLIYPILVAIVSGVVLTAVTFWFFQPQPENLASALEVTYSRQRLEVSALANILKRVDEGQKIKRQKQVDNFTAMFGYDGYISLLEYSVENVSDKVINNFTVSPNNFVFGSIVDDRGYRNIEVGAKRQAIEVLPGKRGTVVLAERYESYDPGHQFLVGDRSVKTAPADVTYRDPVARFFESYSVLEMIIFGAGIISVLFVPLTLVLELLCRYLPNLASSFL